MKLNDNQSAAVKEWAAGGETLTGIQKRLKEELGISLTYLETRLLVGDLGLELDEWKPKPKEEKPEAEEVLPEEEVAAPGLLDGADADGGAGAGVKVQVDKITRPGSIVSGRATFSDGKQVGWYVDQYGRLGLDAGVPGYRPPAADIPVFQATLDRELRKLGL